MINLGGSDGFTAAGWIFLIVMIVLAVFFISLPILTLVNQHRVMNGKEPLNKGKVRKIVVVHKHVSERAFFDEENGIWRTHSPVNSESVPPDLAQEKCVDFRKVGGRVLYTKSIDDELFDQIEIGRTYKVRIRYGCIDKLFEKEKMKM